MAVADHMQWARERVRKILTHGSSERVIGVMIASVDLVAAVDGRTAGLTSEADRALLRAWREAADALLIGTGTLTSELYAGSIMPEDARHRRALRGQQPVPPIITIDRTATLDIEIALRGSDPPPLIVYVQAGRGLVDSRATWVELPEITVTSVLQDARERMGARVILCEGGPLLIRAALEEGQLTDLSLTIDPRYIGSGPRLLQPRWEQQPHIEPLLAEVIDQYVFIHYLIAFSDRPLTASQST